MKIVIIGAGGIGALYGAKLANAGEDVTLFDARSDHVRAMQTHGLHIDGETGPYTVAINAIDVDSVKVDGEGHRGQGDVALICVNSYDTADAALSAQELLRPDGFAVTLQNGLGNIEQLQKSLGPERVVGGITFHSANAHKSGQVSHTGIGKTPIGELDGSASSRVDALAAALDAADLNPEVDPAIIATIWGKFVHNCGLNAICALTDLRPGHIPKVPELDEFQTMIVEEAIALVNAKGILLPDPEPLQSIKAFCAVKFHLVSMVQHLQKGLQTEIDSLNGYLVRESKMMGLTAPYNDALTRLVKGRQFQIEQ